MLFFNKMLFSWRYYSYGPEQYKEYINRLFINNLSTLREISKIVAIILICFIAFPIFYEKNYINALFYLSFAVIAFVLSYYANYKMQTTVVSNRFIYIFITLFYVNIMSFGIYLDIFSHQEKLASVFLCFLICALLMFVNPPQFNLCLTLSAMIAFIVISLYFKPFNAAVYDITRTVLAGIISLYFTWQITKLRFGLEISTTILEEERNKYLDQSTIDELTKLKNRRDFMHTFQRYLTNYRSFDNWLCIAICDIDFFKNYNDHYGHPMGDSCLRSVAGVLNGLMDSMGVYAARVGGEEFALLWFEKNASHVDEVLTHISESIRELKIPHEKSKVSKYVTISIGVYIEHCGVSSETKVLYDLADQALYAAKGKGRNCAIVTGSEIEQYRIPKDADKH
jgi:diguanylate cyclase (GGDEF)-like protein